MSLWTMKDVIRMTGTTENALRYYNAKGVLQPTVRESTGRRQWLYDDEAVEKLKRLSLLVCLGVSVEDAGTAINSGELYSVILKRLEELKEEREKLDLQVFIARTLAISSGEDLIKENEKDEDAKASFLNELIRELIIENAEREGKKT